MFGYDNDGNFVDATNALVETLNAKDAEITSLRTLIDTLMKAVEPFANEAESWIDHDDKEGLFGLTVGDLRRAREAYLNAQSQNKKEG